uniref:DNA-directed DNA polymerase n=1 Tax=Macrostomum lignano TaxID=282301 RepID=A0A1I8H0M8_9PLAT
MLRRSVSKRVPFSEKSGWLETGSRRLNEGQLKLRLSEKSGWLQIDTRRLGEGQLKQSLSEKSVGLEGEFVRRSDALRKPKISEELELKPNKFAVEECRLAERIIRPEAPAHNCGPMDRACDQCGALLWCSETRNFCCAKGKVKLPSRTVPQVLADLYLGRHRMSAEFLTNIRSYNSALHLTSLGAKLRLVPGWCPSFIISGQLHHNTAPLFAEDSAEPHGWQVYFNDRELESRQSLSQKVKPELLELLQTLLHECNGYVRSLRAVAHRISQDPELGDARIVIHPDRRPSGEHIRYVCKTF